MHHEELQKCEFLCREQDLFPLAERFVGVDVETKTILLDYRGTDLRAAPGQGSDARKKLAEMKRFGKIVVGPAVQPFNLVLNFAEATSSAATVARARA